jgi:molybdopterin-guanine dinucleotide biosynthesis protein A
MPFVSASVFRHLLDLQRELDADVVIPKSDSYVEPMHAVYRRATVLAAIEAALARGEQRMISYFSSVRVREVSEAEWQPFDATGQAFFNVNTPADLEQARALAAAAER